MEGPEALSNAGAIPIVIFLTQLIKSRMPKFKAGSDMLALGISFVLCFGWTFYYMSPEDFAVWSELRGLGLFKWLIYQIAVGFGTWLTASKMYDLGHGNKKRQKVQRACWHKRGDNHNMLLLSGNCTQELSAILISYNEISLVRYKYSSSGLGLWSP